MEREERDTEPAPAPTEALCQECGVVLELESGELEHPLPWCPSWADRVMP